MLSTSQRHPEESDDRQFLPGRPAASATSTASTTPSFRPEGEGIDADRTQPGRGSVWGAATVTCDGRSTANVARRAQPMRVTDVVWQGSDPIGESRAVALAINEVIGDAIAEHLDAQRRLGRAALALGAVAVGFGVVGLVTGAVVVGGLVSVLGLGGAVGGVWYARRRTPDVTVQSVNKNYWTGYCIPDGDGAVVYDATGTREPVTFELTQLNDTGPIETARDRLAAAQDYPVVMSHEGNVEADVTATLDDVATEIDRATRRTVEAPLINRERPAGAAVRRFASLGAGRGPVAAPVAVDAATARQDVARIDELRDLADADTGESTLEEIRETGQTVAEDLSGTQESAIDLLNDHVETAADAFGLVSYHFYCPDCLRDDIESEVSLRDHAAREWACDTCRSTWDTEDVIPRHRIKDDVVNPVWDQLWIEKDDQRREIYESIEDQKADLKEREFEQRQDEIRETTSRIKELRARVRDLQTEAQAAQGKVTEIGEMMVEFDRLNEQRKDEFTANVEEAFAEIDAKTEQIVEETRNEEQERIEQAQEAAAEKAQLMREEERIRERQRFMAEQKLENERTKAEMRQDEKHFRQEWMRETRGGLSASSTINRGKMWKDRTLGYEGDS